MKVMCDYYPSILVDVARATSTRRDYTMPMRTALRIINAAKDWRAALELARQDARLHDAGTDLLEVLRVKFPRNVVTLDDATEL